MGHIGVTHPRAVSHQGWHCPGTSERAGIPIGDPFHIAADTLWLSGRNAVTFSERLGKFGFEKMCFQEKEKSDCSWEE